MDKLSQRNWESKEGELELTNPPQIPEEGGGSRRSRGSQNHSLPSRPPFGGKRKRSLPRQQPLQPKGGHSTAGSKVGETKVVNGGPSSSKEDAHNGPAWSHKGSPQGPAKEEAEAHPCLFNEDVLDMVFKHIVAHPGTTKDVQNIRLVCKTWKNSVTRLYRQSWDARAIFEKVDKPWEARKPLSEFVETMSSSDMIPIQKYIFHDYLYGRRNLETFEKFLRLCTSEAVHLNISIMLSDAERILSTINNLPEFSMPKLKSLRFSAITDPTADPCQILKPGHIHGILTLLERFLNAANNLREFEPWFCPRTMGRTKPFPPALMSRQAFVMEQLGQVTARSIPKTVKKLKMRMDISESTFDTLTEAGLKLEEFKFDITSEGMKGTLYKLLQGQASTLKHLHVWDYSRILRPDPSQQSIFLEFPRMDELIHLKLTDQVVSLAKTSEFVKSFPKLHTLNLAGMGELDCLLALLSTVRRSTLKVLYLPNWDSTPEIGPLVKDISQAFPFVVELHITLHSNTRTTLEELFRSFDRIESLNICFAEVDERVGLVESIFMGVSEVDCNRIRRLGNFQNVNLSEFQRKPSILNLTRLKKLVVRRFYLNYPINFTDASAHFIFLGMANLVEIHLNNTQMEFSSRFAELLRDKIILPGRRQT